MWHRENKTFGRALYDIEHADYTTRFQYTRSLRIELGSIRDIAAQGHHRCEIVGVARHGKLGRIALDGTTLVLHTESSGNLIGNIDEFWSDVDAMNICAGHY